MATAPKKNTVGQSAPAPTRAAPAVDVVAPRAVFVLSPTSTDATGAPEEVAPAAKAAPILAAALPVTEIQESVRSALEKGVVESRAAFAKVKASVDDASSAIEVSFAAAKDGVIAINSKAFEALRANAEANFDYLRASFEVKSLSDLVALQSKYARKQVETMTAQAKDIGVLAQKTLTGTVEPIKEQVAKSFKIAI